MVEQTGAPAPRPRPKRGTWRSPVSRPTLEDVAAIAGVSRNTVSLVLQRSPRVRAATGDRVWVAVRETGYQVNHAARALASGRTRTLGVVHFDPESYQRTAFYYPIIASLVGAANERGYDALLLAPRDTGNPHWLREIGRAGRVDGLVFLGTRTDRVAITALAQDGVPMAHIGRREVPGCALSYVAVDNEAGVALATQHLIDHGHRRIAFYAMDLELESHRDRLAGYRHALRVAGVPFDEELVLIGATWAAGAAPSVRLPAGTTALVISDGVGWELIRALQASGTRIPEDVAIVVHNADRSIRSYDPPLTGVVTPQAELGERAAHLVIDLIEGAPSPARQQSLAPQLEIHRSCGCPIPT